MRDWVTADRVRLFAVVAAALFVLALVCLAVPHWLFSFVMAGLLGVSAVVVALMAAATWFANRSGVTDSSDLWDADTSEQPGDAVADLFGGNASFTEDGSR